MQNLANNMQEAWLQKAAAARRNLSVAKTAPALFKPEYIEQLKADYAYAMRQAERWA